MSLFDAAQVKPEPKSASLLDEAKSFGVSALHEVENFAKEHKAITAIGTLAAAGTVFALTRGEASGAAASMAEGALASAGSEGVAAAAATTTAETGGGILSSNVFKFGALPVLSLAGLSLAGCDQEKKVSANVYSNAEECIKNGVFTDRFCNTEYTHAQEVHQQTAPKFETKKECEDKTAVVCTADGAQNNQQTQDSGHVTPIFYRPYMSGYMIGRDSSNSDSQNNFVGRSAPLYRSTDSSASLVTSHDDAITSRTGGQTEVSESTFQNASRAATGSVESPEAAFSRSSTSVTTTEGVSRGAFGSEGAHGVGGEAGGGGHAGGGGGE